MYTQNDIHKISTASPLVYNNMGWLGDGSHRGQVRQAWMEVGLPPRYPQPISQTKLLGVICHIFDHTVLLATRHKQAHRLLTPASKTGSQFHPGGMKGWVDLSVVSWLCPGWELGPRLLIGSPMPKLLRYQDTSYKLQSKMKSCALHKESLCVKQWSNWFC